MRIKQSGAGGEPSSSCLCPSRASRVSQTSLGLMLLSFFPKKKKINHWSKIPPLLISWPSGFLPVKWAFLYLLMETKIFQEDQEKLVAPFFPISSLHVPVTSNNFLRCGLPTNHEDHYKQTSNSPKLQLFFTLLLRQHLEGFASILLDMTTFNSLQRLFSLRIYKFLCLYDHSVL